MTVNVDTANKVPGPRAPRPERARARPRRDAARRHARRGRRPLRARVPLPRVLVFRPNPRRPPRRRYWWHRVETLADDTLSLNFWFHAHLHLAFAAEDAADVPLPSNLVPVLARQVEVFLGDNVGAAFVGDAVIRLCDALGVAHDRTAAWPEEPRVEALIRDFLVERLAENLGGAAHVAPFVAGFLHPSRWADDERAA